MNSPAEPSAHPSTEPMANVLQGTHSRSRQGQPRLGQRKLRVAAPIHSRMLTSSITLPLEILRAAAQASGELPTPEVSLQLLSEHGGPVQPADGLVLHSQRYTEMQSPDLLIVPAIWRNPLRLLPSAQWQLPLIEQCVAAGSQVCSVGSGTFLLAESGLLNHKTATTHWHWFDSFSRRYPTVKLRRDRLITQSETLFCVGSVNSVADLMVYFSEYWFSETAARTVEQQFSPEIRQPFVPHSPWDDAEQHGDEQIADVQVLIRQQLGDPLDIPALAAATGMTTRTLSRRFKRAVGMTPGNYLNNWRIKESRSLLQHSNLSVAEVGWSVGFRDPSQFSRQFRNAVGMTPKRWRMAVRGKSFHPSEQT